MIILVYFDLTNAMIAALICSGNEGQTEAIFAKSLGSSGVLFWGGFCRLCTGFCTLLLLPLSLTSLLLAGCEFKFESSPAHCTVFCILLQDTVFLCLLSQTQGLRQLLKELAGLDIDSRGGFGPTVSTGTLPLRRLQDIIINLDIGINLGIEIRFIFIAAYTIRSCFQYALKYLYY